MRRQAKMMPTFITLARRRMSAVTCSMGAPYTWDAVAAWISSSRWNASSRPWSWDKWGKDTELDL